MEELLAGLRRELDGDVRADAYTRHLYASDASMYAREPVAVAFPRSADDVAAAITIAGRFDLPVVSRGAGTSLTGQAIGAGALVLDTSRHLDAIGEIDTDAKRVRVGPGVVQDDLNAAAKPHGLGFGPDTSTSNRATLGGMIGNNASGSHSIVYGTTVDHVIELDVVLADGSRTTLGPEKGPERIRDGMREILRDHAEAIATGYPKHWRRSGGYGLDRLGNDFNLAKLVTGSEGTLVAITEATVRLVELPPSRVFAVGHFESVADAIAATDAALALEPAAVEMIDRTILSLARTKLEYRRMTDRLEGDPGALLYVTFFGDEGPAKLDELQRSWSAYHTLRAETAADQAALTNVRKAGLGLLIAASEGSRRPLAFVEDTAVAPERLGEYVARFKAILDGHDLDRRLVRARVGRLSAHPPVRRPHRARRGRDDGGGRRAGDGAGHRVRRRELVRARRRARAQRLQPPHLRRRAVRRDAEDQGAVRPAQPAQPGRDGRPGADHRRPA